MSMEDAPTDAPAAMPEQPPPRDDDDAIKAFIGGLAWAVTDQELKEHFDKFGVVSAIVSRDKFTDRSRGFGFVVFETEAGREDAIAEYNQKEVFGREITVAKAVPRGDRPPRRGGYNDRGPRRGGYNDRGPPRRYDDRGPPRRRYDDRGPPRRRYDDDGGRDRFPPRDSYRDRDRSPPRDDAYRY